ncbi:hypothetical protein Ahy_B07g088239 [Arachis hypogaea]|uniref:Uncharacterized protein n=1 Tax=Arachis hypogaea TaxID=3818 RepID=A0A444YDZ4_ARAHY|nr:hypothetical protein Ahy_B07g088239 [Arachis hypogaea]
MESAMNAQYTRSNKFQGAINVSSPQIESSQATVSTIRPKTILPPHLEDCALSPESIHQAFFKAVAAVKSAATIFSDDDDETAGDCVNDPWPAAAEGTSDAVIGIEPENELPGACAVEKVCEEGDDEVKVSGGSSCEVEEVVDEIVVGEGAKLGEGEEEPCIDELQGLGIEDDAKKNKKKNCEEEEKNGDVSRLGEPSTKTASFWLSVTLAVNGPKSSNII